MTCPDCSYAIAHPDTGIADATCLDCCVRVIEGLRPHRELQDRMFDAWQSMPGYVGTKAVVQALQARAQMRAMAPLEAT